jgi:hypothetical protein
MVAKQGAWPINTKLRSDNYLLSINVELLQKALAFWLPHRPATELPKALEERLEHDIGLLAGYMGKIEPDAEELGWIKLQHRGDAP